MDQTKIWRSFTSTSRSVKSVRCLSSYRHWRKINLVPSLPRMLTEHSIFSRHTMMNPSSSRNITWMTEKVQRVKALDEFAYKGSMDLISDNRKLLMYGAMEDGSKDISWSIYDFDANKVINHRVTGKYPNQFGMTQTFNTDKKLYQVFPTNKSSFQVPVIDLTNDSIEYQGFIRDKNERKNFGIYDFRIKG